MWMKDLYQQWINDLLNDDDANIIEKPQEYFEKIKDVARYQALRN